MSFYGPPHPDKRAGAPGAITDLHAELDRIIVLAQRAKQALADEHEGDLTAAVLDLEGRVDGVFQLVMSW